MGGGITGSPRPGVPGLRGVKRDAAALGVSGMPAGVNVAGINPGWCIWGFPAAAAKGAVTAVTDAGRGCGGCRGWCGGVDSDVGATTAGPPNVGMASPGGPCPSTKTSCKQALNLF